MPATRHAFEHEDAHEELLEAALAYERNRDGLGELFNDAVEAAVASVLDPTISWGFYGDIASEPQLFSRSVKGFPFDVVCVVEGDRVIIVAYAREQRRPGYWRNRLEER